MYQRGMFHQAWKKKSDKKSDSIEQNTEMQAFVDMLLEQPDLCWGEGLNETYRNSFYDTFDDVVSVLLTMDDPYMTFQSIQLADLNRPKEVETLQQFIRDCDPDKHRVSLRYLVKTGQPNLLNTIKKKKQLPGSVCKALGIPSKKERAVYYVVRDGESGNWQVKREGVRISTSIHEKKSEAISAASELAKGRIPSQVKILKKDGKFQKEYTYGDDPKEYPG